MTDQTDFRSHHDPSDHSEAHVTENEFVHDVKEFVLRKLQEDSEATITSTSLTLAFLDEFTDRYGPLGRWNVAAYIGVGQTIRPLLRKNGDPSPDQIDLDLPETALLQKRYGVPGAAGEGESAYVPRHKLTKEQMQLVVGRYRAMSIHYARCADALESWWHRQSPGQSD
jgi:hypothetical protein